MSSNDDYYHPTQPDKDQTDGGLSASVSKISVSDGTLGSDSLKTGASGPMVHPSAASGYSSEPRANSVQPLSSSSAAVPPRALPLDINASHIDTYSAPTPIHLTFHPDPEEEEQQQQEPGQHSEAQQAAAIAYLKSVHPALPPTTSSSSQQSGSQLEQPQSGTAHRGTEGAAASLNGQWTPMEAAAAAASSASSAPAARPSSPALHDVHGDQVYASEQPVIETPPLPGRTVRTRTHDQQDYCNRQIVNAGGDAAAAAPAAASAAALSTPPSGAQPAPVYHADTGSSRQLVAGDASAPQVVQVHDTSELRGERLALGSAAFSTAAQPSQVIGSSSSPQVVQVADRSQLRGEMLPIAAGAAAGVAAGSAAGMAQKQESEASTSAPQVQQANDATVLRGERVAVGSAGSTAGSQPSQVIGSSSSPQVVTVADSSQLRGELLPIAAAAGSTRAAEQRQTFSDSSVASVQQVDDVSSIAARNILPQQSSVTQQSAPATKLLDASASAPQVVQVDDTSALRGERLALGSARFSTATQPSIGSSASPQVVQVADSTQLRGEMLPVAVPTGAAEQRQVFSSDSSVASIQNVADVSSIAASNLLPQQSSVLPQPTTCVLPTTLSPLPTVQLTDDYRVHPSVAAVTEQTHRLHFQPVDETQLAGAVLVEGQPTPSISSGGLPAEHSGTHLHSVKMGQGVVQEEEQQ